MKVQRAANPLACRVGSHPARSLETSLQERVTLHRRMDKTPAPGLNALQWRGSSRIAAVPARPTT